jgi:hypothetical protein
VCVCVSATKEVVLQVIVFRITEDEELLSLLPFEQNEPVNTDKLLKVPFSKT